MTQSQVTRPVRRFRTRLSWFIDSNAIGLNHVLKTSLLRRVLTMLRTSIQVVESCEVSIKIASQKMRLKSIACLSNACTPLVPISSLLALFVSSEKPFRFGALRASVESRCPIFPQPFHSAEKKLHKTSSKALTYLVSISYKVLSIGNG